jgi:hypothetical protein
MSSDLSNHSRRTNFNLLDHLESSYERQWNQKENLEKKANQAIQICGLIFGLLFGLLNISLVRTADSADKILIPEISIYLLLGGIISSLVCIIIAFLVTRLEEHTFVFSNAMEIKNIYQPSKVDDLEKEKKAIDAYLNGIENLVWINLRKARKIKYVQFFMIASILLLMCSLLVTILVKI